MYNKNIINNFKKLINYIQIQNDYITNKNEIKINTYRILSLKKSLKIISNLNFNIKNISDISNISGIGKGTLYRIDEILKSGKLKELKNYNKNILKYNKYNKIINNLMEVIGIGRKIAKQLINNYNIKSVKQLILLSKNNKINLNNKIKLGLKYLGLFKGSIPCTEIDIIYNYLQNITDKYNNNMFITVCGSYRRGLSISSDIDILLSDINYLYLKDINNNELKNYISYLHKINFLVDDITDKNIITKYMGFCKYNNYPIRRIDIRYIPMESYFTALFYFTGSYDFNKYIRNIAKKNGYKLNEYELKELNSNNNILILSEQDIFDILKHKYIYPNDR